jgi:two-component system, NarL family, nitrate/nitrite response regulator NarL
MLIRSPCHPAEVLKVPFFRSITNGWCAGAHFVRSHAMVIGMNKLNVLVVDDHVLFAEGLKLLLEALGLVSSVHCCANGLQAVDCALSNPIDIVLLDWNLGPGLSGQALMDELKATHPLLRAIVLSADDSSRMVRQAVDAGAVGFVPKGSSSDALIKALTITAYGGIYLPDTKLLQSTQPLANAYVRDAAQTPVKVQDEIRNVFPSLTAQQINVLAHAVSGAANKTIARALDISEGTVKQHLNAIYREMGVNKRTEAVYLLANKGLRVFGTHE